jgi:hypothetical protein
MLVCDGYEQLDMFNYKHSEHILVVDRVTVKKFLQMLKEIK